MISRFHPVAHTSPIEGGLSGAHPPWLGILSSVQEKSGRIVLANAQGHWLSVPTRAAADRIVSFFDGRVTRTLDSNEIDVAAKGLIRNRGAQNLPVQELALMNRAVERLFQLNNETAAPSID